MIIQLTNGHTAKWNGGHYINFFDENDYNYDCISFMWEKNKPTQLDALEAYLRCLDIVMGEYKDCEVCGYFLINDPEAGIVEETICGDCEG
jgi:hypothetical protein